jgi:small-conductance mechanosensitive channel
LQALGLEVRSVLAIGGIGGLAIGLAGREICENLLNGMLLMTTVSSRQQMGKHAFSCSMASCR